MKRILVTLTPVIAVLALLVVGQAWSASRTGEGWALDRLSPASEAVVAVSQGTATQVETGGGATEDTPFLIGSVSKVFTAVAVMQQVEAGHLRLDAPLDDEVPPALRGVTVQQLLNHTSGLTRRAGLELADIRPTTEATLAGLVELLDAHDIGHRPGDHYEYSDANYLVLGHLVEQVSGQEFGPYLEAHVLRPLGMRNSRATAEGARHTGVGAGHRVVFGLPLGYSAAYAPTGAPYGYVVSTAHDLGLFGRWLIHPGTHGSVLSPTAVARLSTPGPRTSTGQRYGMGLRVGRLDGDGPRVVEHTGATPGMFTHLMLLPDEDTTIVVLADAYAEALGGRFASVGWDLARENVGRHRAGGSADPLQTCAPWLMVLLAATGAGLLLGAPSRASDRRRPVRRALLSVLALAAAVGLLGLPRLLDLGWRELLIWAPGLAWATIAASILWGILGLLTLTLLARHRGPGQGVVPPPTPAASPTGHEAPQAGSPTSP